MIPYRVTAAAYNANASPSVTLEKGAYRLRAPTHSSRQALQPPMDQGIRPRNPSQSQLRVNYTLLVLILLLACLFCFGAAWHLYSTRWDTRYMVQPALLTDQPQVRARPIALDDRYMTYLPHSGFHNQRIALENALVLSILLNRTLIIPPIRLGRKPFRYVKYKSLSRFHALGGKEGLYHCSAIPSHMALPSECSDFFDYTDLPWNWLVNTTQHPQVLEQDSVALLRGLKVNDTNSMVLPDESPYHYRFHDTPLDMSVERTSKYIDHIYIYDITNSSKRFLHFGTLFGTSRLLLRKARNLALRSAIRRSMVFANPILGTVVDNIREAIGSSYNGAHIRISDGQFEKKSASNIHEIWWKVIRTSYGYSDSEGIELEAMFQPSTGNLSNSRFSICRGEMHENPGLVRLNVPLFISTDCEKPRAEGMFSIFLRTFPCLLFISDFGRQLEPLRTMMNENDGVGLGEFVVPFLDAMILGHASGIVTTEGSTFGRFVEDVLGRVYRGQEIVERG